MAIGPEIQYAKVDELLFDPMNPRLGRANIGAHLSQEKILDFMRDWTLEELGASFVESGFWPQEALLVVEEKVQGKTRLVVVEGNRRLAALTYLQEALDGRPVSRKWKEILDEKKPPPELFSRVPYLRASSRQEIEAFVGFRHVTGIKEWKPAEKAAYIAKLIESRGLSYREVTRKIGSKTPVVRQHYIAYRLLLQMEGEEGISIEHVEDKFSVLYLSLRTAGVQGYLQIDMEADPEAARRPVPLRRRKALANFALWLFGDKKHPPLFTDSRLVDDFGRVLESSDAAQYLERSEKPSFEVALRRAGGDEPELVSLVERAADSIELALTRAHLHVKSERFRIAVERMGADAFQLLRLFPAVLGSLIQDQR